MREDIKIIKLTGAICIISFLCTYLICINIETSFFSPDSIFVSNNFLLTISGGVLTGAILSLILEIQKYLLDNRRCFGHHYYISDGDSLKQREYLIGGIVLNNLQYYRFYHRFLLQYIFEYILAIYKSY